MSTWTPQRIEEWLRRYREWRVELDGAIRAAQAIASEGSTGRGGERASLTEIDAERLAELSERCRLVEEWRQRLRPLERIAFDVYTRPGGDWQSGVEELARRGRLPRSRAADLLQALPTIIYAEWYAGREETPA